MQYTICGVLGEGAPECEDFLPQSGGRKVTMTVDASVPAGEYLVEADEGDGWVDILVPEMTEDAAKLALAKINGLQPQEIEIVQNGLRHQ